MQHKDAAAVAATTNVRDVDTATSDIRGDENVFGAVLQARKRMLAAQVGEVMGVWEGGGK